MPKLYEMLGTKKVKDQEKRVEQLLGAAQAPVMSIMVLMDQRSGRLDIRAAGVDNAGVGDIKYVLRQAVDQLTIQEAELRTQQNEVVPEDEPPVQQTEPLGEDPAEPLT